MSFFDSYEVVGPYRRDRHHAHRLATNGHIRARVAFLQAQASRSAVITLEGLLAQAEEARVGAMAAGQFGAAIAAIKEIGILSGLRVEKREQAHKTIDQMTNDELRAIAARGRPQ
ncbi:hypothetical protein SAMN05444161_6878 [Rhizobiales bacterium GAS191]|nr:hypothetical protein SAMN05444161_6878 [Rhizobiales bacterium GAS191]